MKMGDFNAEVTLQIPWLPSPPRKRGGEGSQNQSCSFLCLFSKSPRPKHFHQSRVMVRCRKEVAVSAAGGGFAGTESLDDFRYVNVTLHYRVAVVDVKRLAAAFCSALAAIVAASRLGPALSSAFKTADWETKSLSTIGWLGLLPG